MWSRTPAICRTPASGATSGRRMIIEQKSSRKTGEYLFSNSIGNGPEFVRNPREWCHNRDRAPNRRCGAARIGVI
jgi:hypothetical protein